MTAELPLANAGFSYASDPNTGMHRIGADEQAIECGGVDIVEIKTTGMKVTAALEVTGAITSGGVAILPIGLGPLPWSGLTAPAKWVLCYGQTLLRSDYPALWTFASGEIAGGNILYTNGNGSTTFTVPDMRGNVPAGKDNMGGVAANRLTSPTMIPNGNTLGAIGGDQQKTLLTSNLPPYTPAGTNGTVSVTGQQGVTQFSGNIGLSAGGNSVPVIIGANITPTATGSGPTFTGAAQGGTSTPFAVAQPSVITNYIIYAGA